MLRLSTSAAVTDGRVAIIGATRISTMYWSEVYHAVAVRPLDQGGSARWQSGECVVGDEGEVGVERVVRELLLARPESATSRRAGCLATAGRAERPIIRGNATRRRLEHVGLGAEG